MRVVKISGLSAVAVVGLAVASPAMAASDASNSQGVANQAVASSVSPVASTQTASLVGTAIGNALSGGFTGGGGGGFGGFGAGGNGGFSGTGGPQSSNFGAPAGSFNPNSPANVPGGPVGMLMNTRETGQAGGGAPAKLGVWAQGSWTSIDKTETALGMNGNVYNIVGGLDYKFNDRVLAGLALGGEWTRITTGFNNGTYDGDGVTVAPYLGVPAGRAKYWRLSILK